MKDKIWEIGEYEANVEVKVEGMDEGDVALNIPTQIFSTADLEILIKKLTKVHKKLTQQSQGDK